jgi:hypothetical protein
VWNQNSALPGKEFEKRMVLRLQMLGNYLVLVKIVLLPKHQKNFQIFQQSFTRPVASWLIAVFG